MNILKKGLLLIAVPLCFQVVFLVMVGVVRRNAVRAETWMIHTKDVFVQSRTLPMTMLNAHGTLQGYVITRDQAFADRFAGEAQRADDEATRLVSLVGDQPAQRPLAEQVASDVRQFTGYLREGANLIRADRLDTNLAATRRRVAQEFLERTQNDLKVFLAGENTLDRQRTDRLNLAWARLDALLVGGLVLSVLTTVVIAVLFARSISGRISVLTDNAERLAEGRELAPSLGGRDEIATLDRVFHRMAATLAQAAEAERDHARAMAARAEELATVNGQLQEKNQENEMFVYSVSHDLRSPLVNLQGFSKELGLIGKDLRAAVDRDEVPQPVRTRAVELLDVDVAESIRFIQSAVSRLSAIIDALLRLSRAGRVEYRPQRCDVDATVRRIITALGQTIRDKGAEVSVGPLPPAHVDPTALEQVLGNLVGNALNYLDPNRPGVVRIEQDESEAAVHLAETQGWVIYAVRDNGLGIADAYKPKIFSAFQRLHGDIAKGEGIGLALARRVVERLGGRIWFESTAGEGSSFLVAVPADGVRPREDPAELVSSGNMELTRAGGSDFAHGYHDAGAGRG